ncbi:MAG: hypothetical protein AABY09_02240 [Nanoarchaeota archaeon]
MVVNSKSLADVVRDVGGSLITEDFNSVSEVYAVVYDDGANDYNFKKIVKPRGSRCDPHRHSGYSNEVIGSTTTRLLNVRESYAKVSKVLDRSKKDGMDFFALQDHNTIDGYLDLYKYSMQHGMDKTFLSCEYDVKVSEGKTVHVGVWGLDYPAGSGRISIKEVDLVHESLMKLRKQGIDQFRRGCDSMGLISVLNHPPWLSTPARPLTGEEFSHICDVFDYLEINGDSQKENLFTLEVALEKGKILVGGSDLHNLRKSNAFTETIYPVGSAREYLDEVRKGLVAVGSCSRMPKSIKHADALSVLRTKFNGTRSDFYDNIYRGMGGYLMHEWGLRKVGFLGAFTGLGAAGYFIYPPLLALPFVAFAWLSFAFPIRYGMAERAAVKKRTEALYGEYQDYRLRKAIGLLPEMGGDDRAKEVLRLEELIGEKKRNFDAINFKKGTRWWEVLASKLMPWGTFEPNYDFSILLHRDK